VASGKASLNPTACGVVIPRKRTKVLLRAGLTLVVVLVWTENEQSRIAVPQSRLLRAEAIQEQQRGNRGRCGRLGQFSLNGFGVMWLCCV
jgi:hypothetical protein